MNILENCVCFVSINNIIVKNIDIIKCKMKLKIKTKQANESNILKVTSFRFPLYFNILCIFILKLQHIYKHILMHDAEAQATAIWNIKTHQLSYKPTQIVRNMITVLRTRLISYHIAWLGEKGQIGGEGI